MAAKAKPYKLKFSPSSSKRWMNCAGSVRLVAELPKKPSGKFALEGTAAHELASTCLENGDNADEWIGEEIEVEDEVFKVNQNMADAVQVYLDAVRQDLEDNGIDQSALSIEKKFQIDGIACLKGTNDASFSSLLGQLFVYDYKHGVGLYVDVKDNPQLMIYAIGAMQLEGWVNESIKIVIAQPRYRDDSQPKVRSWDLSKEALLAFKKEVKEAIDKALDPTAKCTPGPWCGESFCPAFGVCPAVRRKAMDVVDPQSKALTFPDPTTLKPEYIAKVLEVSGLISSWVKAVQAHAQEQAISFGAVIPGYKVVEKKGRRRWVDESMVEAEFEHEFGDKIYDKKIKSPAQIEKLTGKEGKPRVAELTEIPDNGLQLVPDSAKGDGVEPNVVFKKIKK